MFAKQWNIWSSIWPLCVIIHMEIKLLVRVKVLAAVCQYAEERRKKENEKGCGCVKHVPFGILQLKKRWRE